MRSTEKCDDFIPDAASLSVNVFLVPVVKLNKNLQPCVNLGFGSNNPN